MLIGQYQKKFIKLRTKRKMLMNKHLHLHSSQHCKGHSSFHRNPGKYDENVIYFLIKKPSYLLKVVFNLLYYIKINTCEMY